MARRPTGRSGRRFSPMRTPRVLQLEASECGAASLAIILAAHGRYVTLERLRSLCGVSRDGAKASAILRAARSFGLEAAGVDVGSSHLEFLKPPFIAFVDYGHFLVVEGIRGKTVYLNDPAIGRMTLPMTDFAKRYSGVVLTMQPTDEFVPGDARPSPWRVIAGRLRGYRLAMLFVVLANVALIIPGIVVPVFSRIFVDDVLVRGLDDWLLPLLIGMALTAIAQFVLAELRGQTLNRIQQALTVDTGHQLFAKLLQLPINFFEQRFAGEVADRVRANEELSTLVTQQLAGATIAVISAQFFALVMLLYSPLLTLAVVAIALINFVVLAVSIKMLSARYLRVAIDEGRLHGARIAALQDIETFKASAAEDIVFARWLALQTRVVNQRQAAGRVMAWVAPVPGLLNALIVATVLIGGGYLVMRGDMTLGTLVAFQGLAASFAAPIGQLAGFGADLQELRAYTQRIDDVLEQPADFRFSASTAPAAVGRLPIGRLRVKNVSFGYSPLDPPFIEGFELEATPGQRIAVVGASGSGKSTIGKLIAGLESPWSGSIHFDAIPLREWPREAFAARVGYVAQDLTLFAGTIRDNLTLWDPAIEEPVMVRAAHDARLHGVISARAGYDAPLAENGRDFSAGERQRLELARALTRDPQLLILDEATSALDPVTEEAVMAAIRRRSVTCIIIAHRLSTIRDCDEIIVLDEGKVVERGSHAALMAAKGHYSRLYAA
jgi:NHLM bacteriocin system ABC transporter peptidase/ATP-binding protein